MARHQPAEPVDVRIIEIAADHIRKFGLRRTTIVAIAEEAGMSHANIYRYFPSKAALVEAVTDHWLRPVEAGLREIADGPDPSLDKLERIAGAIFRAYRDKLEQDTELFDLFAEMTEKGAAPARRHRARLRQEIGRVVEEGASSEMFREADQRRAIVLVFDALHRFLHPVSVGLDREVPRGQLVGRFERVLRMVLRSLPRSR